MTESSAEFEIFGTGPSGTIHASCFDEDPNGISILTKSDSKTCCKDENIIPDVNEEKSCEDMDNRRSVFTFSLLRPFEFLVASDGTTKRVYWGTIIPIASFLFS